jgi:hypothetical protein
MSHAFSEVTSVTRDRFVRNSGFEAQIIADLRPILRAPPGQRYRGASGGLPAPTAAARSVILSVEFLASCHNAIYVWTVLQRVVVAITQ